MTDSMRTEQPIVVAYDGSESAERALRWAARRARQGDTHLRVITVAARGLDSEGALHRGLELAEEAGARVTGALISKPVAPALVHASEHASLLVIGTDRSTENPALVLGALPVKLAASSRCPLAVIPADPPGERRGVLCGFEVDAEGDLALTSAVREARRLGAPLRVVHVMPSAGRVGTATEDDLAADRVAQRLARQQIAAILSVVRGDGGVEVSTEIRTGDPAMILIREAAHCELLVIGSHGKDALGTFLLGSVCHDVLMNIRCPVIVMPAVPSRSSRTSGGSAEMHTPQPAS